MQESAFHELQQHMNQVAIKLKQITNPEVRRDLLRELRLLLVEFDLQLLELPD
jgi:hypothetical protein